MSNPKDDFLSFEKALRELKMESEELKKLVSEGEIRAFRDGGSMKFRKEDINSLATRRTGEDQLVFADALEDDTGMVTEELSDDDTLLQEEEPAPVRGRASAPASKAKARPIATAVEAEAPSTPGWVTVAAVLAFAVLAYGAMVVHNVTSGQAPGGLTSMWAPKTAAR